MPRQQVRLRLAVEALVHQLGHERVERFALLLRSGLQQPLQLGDLCLLLSGELGVLLVIFIDRHRAELGVFFSGSSCVTKRAIIPILMRNKRIKRHHCVIRRRGKERSVYKLERRRWAAEERSSSRFSSSCRRRQNIGITKNWSSSVHHRT